MHSFRHKLMFFWIPSNEASAYGVSIKQQQQQLVSSRDHAIKARPSRNVAGRDPDIPISPTEPEANPDEAGPKFRVQQTAAMAMANPLDATVSMTVEDSFVRRVKNEHGDPHFFFLISKRNVSGRFWRFMKTILDQGQLIFCNGLV